MTSGELREWKSPRGGFLSRPNEPNRELGEFSERNLTRSAADGLLSTGERLVARRDEPGLYGYRDEDVPEPTVIMGQYPGKHSILQASSVAPLG